MDANPLDTAIDAYLTRNARLEVSKFILNLQEVSYLKNADGQVIQIIASCDPDDHDTSHGFRYQPMHKLPGQTTETYCKHPDPDVYPLQRKLTEEVIIFVLDHVHDYSDVECDRNEEVYLEKIKQGKILFCHDRLFYL